jgi:hypothetical protein
MKATAQSSAILGQDNRHAQWISAMKALTGKFAMFRKWTAICMILVGVMAFLLPQAIPACAQEATPENDDYCVACHEHRYYVYDSGKWFCLCEAPMHCVYCHGGRTDSPVEEIAHEGLVLYPTRNHAERCQTCHTEDYLERVVTFASVAGISATPLSVITATPQAVAPSEQPPVSPLTRLARLETWRIIGLGILGVAMLGIAIFGYRCWRADCLPNIHP